MLIDTCISHAAHVEVHWLGPDLHHNELQQLVLDAATTHQLVECTKQCPGMYGAGGRAGIPVYQVQFY